MILVWICNVGHRPLRNRGIDHHVTVAVQEVHPLKLKGDALSRCSYVGVHGLLPIGLATHVLEECAHRLLDRLDDMRLEGLKVLLHRNKVVPAIVLLEDLAMKPVLDFFMDEIWVMVRLDLASRSVKRCGMLTKCLNVLLGVITCSGNTLGAFGCASGQLLVFVLDLSMKAGEDRKDRTIEVLCGFEMCVGNSLGVYKG